MARVECATPGEALRLLRHCLNGGTVQPTAHFLEELSNENLEFEDALAVLNAGAIYSPPEVDIRTGDWKWRIEGREPGGQWIAIIFTFRTVDRAVLITIFSVRR